VKKPAAKKPVKAKVTAKKTSKAKTAVKTRAKTVKSSKVKVAVKAKGRPVKSVKAKAAVKLKAKTGKPVKAKTVTKKTVRPVQAKTTVTVRGKPAKTVAKTKVKPVKLKPAVKTRAKSTKPVKAKAVIRTTAEPVQAIKPIEPKAAAKQAAPARVSPNQALLDQVLAQLEDAKATDIVAINLDGKSAIADDMVVATGRSNRHVGAIADQLVGKLKANGQRNIRVEGMEQCDWVLVDTGDIIVHLFRPEVRNFYNLEKLWSEHSPHETPAK
jgi:ribosome-associated protein